MSGPLKTKFDKWIETNGKQSFIKIIDGSLTLREIYRKVGYKSSSGGHTKFFWKTIEKYNIIYDF